jgi:hypothetical protein
VALVSSAPISCTPLVRELREEVLIAAETSSVLTERLFRTMNLMDPPADYNPLLDDRCNAIYGNQQSARDDSSGTYE